MSGEWEKAPRGRPPNDKWGNKKVWNGYTKGYEENQVRPELAKALERFGGSRRKITAAQGTMTVTDRWLPTASLPAIQKVAKDKSVKMPVTLDSVSVSLPLGKAASSAVPQQCRRPRGRAPHDEWGNEKEWDPVTGKWGPAVIEVTPSVVEIDGDDDEDKSFATETQLANILKTTPPGSVFYLKGGSLNGTTDYTSFFDKRGTTLAASDGGELWCYGYGWCEEVFDPDAKILWGEDAVASEVVTHFKNNGAVLPGVLRAYNERIGVQDGEHYQHRFIIASS